MAKRVVVNPKWLVAPGVVDVYSVSCCVSEDFDDYIHYWKHNGYWLFDSAELIRDVAMEGSASLEGTNLFYYEIYEKEFDGKVWNVFEPERSFKTTVQIPTNKRLEGFDVVAFYLRNSPEHSPLSCNSLAEDVTTNSHCLFDTFDEAKLSLEGGAFKNCEPGPYRIFAVYSVHWPPNREA